MLRLWPYVVMLWVLLCLIVVGLPLSDAQSLVVDENCAVDAIAANNRLYALAQGGKDTKPNHLSPLNDISNYQLILDNDVTLNNIYDAYNSSLRVPHLGSSQHGNDRLALLKGSFVSKRRFTSASHLMVGNRASLVIGPTGGVVLGPKRCLCESTALPIVDQNQLRCENVFVTDPDKYVDITFSVPVGSDGEPVLSEDEILALLAELIAEATSDPNDTPGDVRIVTLEEQDVEGSNGRVVIYVATVTARNENVLQEIESLVTDSQSVVFTESPYVSHATLDPAPVANDETIANEGFYVSVRVRGPLKHYDGVTFVSLQRDFPKLLIQSSLTVSSPLRYGLTESEITVTDWRALFVSPRFLNYTTTAQMEAVYVLKVANAHAVDGVLASLLNEDSRNGFAGNAGAVEAGVGAFAPFQVTVPVTAAPNAINKGANEIKTIINEKTASHGMYCAFIEVVEDDGGSGLSDLTDANEDSKVDASLYYHVVLATRLRVESVLLDVYEGIRDPESKVRNWVVGDTNRTAILYTLQGLRPQLVLGALQSGGVSGAVSHPRILNEFAFPVSRCARKAQKGQEMCVRGTCIENLQSDIHHFNVTCRCQGQYFGVRCDQLELNFPYPTREVTWMPSYAELAEPTTFFFYGPILNRTSSCYVSGSESEQVLATLPGWMTCNRNVGPGQPAGETCRGLPSATLGGVGEGGNATDGDTSGTNSSRRLLAVADENPYEDPFFQTVQFTVPELAAFNREDGDFNVPITLILDHGEGGANDNKEYVTLRNAVYFPSLAAVELDCLRLGVYLTSDGLSCEQCPDVGAVCPGDSRIIAEPGYWQRDLHSAPFQCRNPDACLGGHEEPFCATGYEGHACSDCSKVIPGYYAYQFECLPCDHDPAFYQALFFVAGTILILYGLAIGFLPGVSVMNLIAGIKITQLVVYLMKVGMDNRDDDNIKELVSWASIFNLDTDFVKPGCSTPLITVTGRFVSAMALFGIGMVLTVLFVGVRIVVFKRDVQWNLQKWRAVVGILALVELAYFRLVIAVLEGLHCVESNDDWVLAVRPTETCWEDRHLLTYPFMWLVALLTIVAYPTIVVLYAKRSSTRLRNATRMFLIGRHAYDKEQELRRINEEQGLPVKETTKLCPEFAGLTPYLLNELIVETRRNFYHHTPIKSAQLSKAAVAWLEEVTLEHFPATDRGAVDWYFTSSLRPNRHFSRLVPYVVSTLLVLQATVSPDIITRVTTACYIFLLESVLYIAYKPYSERRKYFKRYVMLTGYMGLQVVLVINNWEKASVLSKQPAMQANLAIMILLLLAVVALIVWQYHGEWFKHKLRMYQRQKLKKKIVMNGKSDEEAEQALGNAPVQGLDFFGRLETLVHFENESIATARGSASDSDSDGGDSDDDLERSVTVEMDDFDDIKRSVSSSESSSQESAAPQETHQETHRSSKRISRASINIHDPWDEVKPFRETNSIFSLPDIHQTKHTKKKKKKKSSRVKFNTDHAVTYAYRRGSYSLDPDETKRRIRAEALDGELDQLHDMYLDDPFAPDHVDHKKHTTKLAQRRGTAFSGDGNGRGDLKAQLAKFNNDLAQEAESESIDTDVEEFVEESAEDVSAVEVASDDFEDFNEIEESEEGEEEEEPAPPMVDHHAAMAAKIRAQHEERNQVVLHAGEGDKSDEHGSNSSNSSSSAGSEGEDHFGEQQAPVPHMPPRVHSTVRRDTLFLMDLAKQPTDRSSASRFRVSDVALTTRTAQQLEEELNSELQEENLRKSKQLINPALLSSRGKPAKLSMRASRGGRKPMSVIKAEAEQAAKKQFGPSRHQQGEDDAAAQAAKARASSKKRRNTSFLVKFVEATLDEDVDKLAEIDEEYESESDDEMEKERKFLKRKQEQQRLAALEYERQVEVRESKAQNPPPADFSDSDSDDDSAVEAAEARRQQLQSEQAPPKWSSGSSSSSSSSSD